jgi:hypothetical protein
MQRRNEGFYSGSSEASGSFSSSSSNPATRSDGVLECWSTAPIRNCAPRPRGRECFRGWLRSFSPFGTTNPRYLSACSTPHQHSITPFEDEDEDDWRLAPPSRRADQDTGQKHQNTTENDLENGREQWRIHEMVPYPGDNAKLNRHHNHGDEGGQ